MSEPAPTRYVGISVDGETNELYTPNLCKEELRCDCENCKGLIAHKMDAESLSKFQIISVSTGSECKSAYRCRMHKQEYHKKSLGVHTKGVAMDFSVKGGAQRMAVIRIAVKLGATGIGVANSFVHVDFRDDTPPMAWKY